MVKLRACKRLSIYNNEFASRRELKVFGVSVHIIEPGLHKTEIANLQAVIDSYTSAYEALPEHVKEEYGREYLETCKIHVL